MKYSVRALLAVAFSVIVGMPTIMDTPVVAAASPQISGSGGLDFAHPDNVVPATGPHGEPGRNVFLTGAITGLNFEPGTCVADPSAGGTCFNFTDSTPVGTGEFLRAHSGQSAFTYCSNPCTVLDEAGVPRSGSFTLHIAYPTQNPKKTPVTHFTIQDAAGGLAGLHGEGSLNLLTGQYTLKYHF